VGRLNNNKGLKERKITGGVMTKKNIYLVSDVDKTRELRHTSLVQRMVWSFWDLLVVMNSRN
jgi:hypothetical protein